MVKRQSYASRHYLIVIFLCLLAGLIGGPAAAAVESVMEVPATPAELEAFKQAHADDPFVVFTDDRLHSVRRNDMVPARWLDDPLHHVGVFVGSAQPGEFYVFQLAVWAHQTELKSLKTNFYDIHNLSGASLPAARFRCLSLGGIGGDGQPFIKDLGVPAGKLQVLWVGVDVPVDARGRLVGVMRVSAEGMGVREVTLDLTVDGATLADHGDRDAWRLSRLRWLDSNVGLDPRNQPTRPFTSLIESGGTINVLGRDVEFGGLLPRQVNSHFNLNNTALIPSPAPLLARPMRFVLVSGSNEIESDGAFCQRQMEFDGFISYRCSLGAKDDMTLSDIRLEIPLAPHAATYMMGLGRQGGLRPESFDWKWDRAKFQDAVWVGGINAGLMIRLKSRDYVRPLIDIYYQFRPLNLPEGWDNGGKGGVSIRTKTDEVLLTAFTGPLTIKGGQSLALDFDLYLTPFKPIDTDTHWRDRFYHPWLGNVMNLNFMEPRLVTAKGANIVNAHHNTNFNPFINYPYNGLSFAEMQDYIRRAHAADLKVKVYYTTREITNNMPEFWAMYSMNGEVIFPGPGNDLRNVIHPNGPDPWYVEHLGHDYIPAWKETIRGRYGNVKDLAVLTTPDTRWDNFYLEGLRYMVENADLDGVYIDGTALGRTALQRARRILDGQVSGKPRRGLIDFHAGSSFSEMGCWASTAILYMEIFPYLDRLWFGEGFDYEKMSPDQWLIEVSGIPFGLMGEMLGRGNPWRGMVFGMTNRLGWGGDPRGLWRLFDDFGMEGSVMRGYWDPACPVTTGDPLVPATVYAKNGRAMIALASWRDGPASVKLKIDWQALGIDPARARLRAPAINKMQMPRRFKVDEPIPVEPGRGWVLVLE